jgi:tryptophan synthase alpha chain
VARIRRATNLPIVVGFGISRREHVRAVAAHADGVVVGSALVNCIRENLGRPDAIVQRLAAVASDLAAGLTRA